MILALSGLGIPISSIFPESSEPPQVFHKKHEARSEGSKISVQIGRHGREGMTLSDIIFGPLLQRLTKTIKPSILSPRTPGNRSVAGKPTCIVIIGF